MNHTCNEREALIVLTPELPHYARLVCSVCSRFIKWLPKPDGEASKYLRPTQHRELAQEYSKGYCELCLRKESDLSGRQVLEAHHVIEYQDGGSHARDNIWVVCTGCSKLIHLIRTYYREKKEDMGAKMGL